MKMHAFNLITTGTILLSYFLNIVRAEYLYLLSSFSSKVGAGNFTYYKLTREGNIQIQLFTTVGDADLYVSDKTLNPDYSNYEVQSMTCGEDLVDISDSMQRPVGIGVFGHPYHPESHFHLSVYMESPGFGSSYSANSQSYHTSQSTASNFANTKPEVDSNEESVLWSVFVGILKIIFDILV